MPLYHLSNGEIQELIDVGIADEPIHEENGTEITYIETFRFYRPLGEDEWIGPHYPRPLLDAIFQANDIVPEFLDTEDEIKEEESTTHLEEDALEEEARAVQSVNTRLNKHGD